MSAKTDMVWTKVSRENQCQQQQTWDGTTLATTTTTTTTKQEMGGEGT